MEQRDALSLAVPILDPDRLRSRPEVLSRPSPVPSAPGIYAWYFTSVPGVPSSGCVASGGLTLCRKVAA